MWNLFNQERINELDRMKAVKEAEQKGKEQNIIESIKSLMKKLNFTAIQAMDALEIPVADQSRYLAMI